MIKKGTKLLDLLDDKQKEKYLNEKQAKKLEQSNAQKVLRRFANKIKELGFKRTKPTFFTRESDVVIEFLHVHKYSFGPYFRVHVSIRVLNDPKDFVALSGYTEKEFQENIKFEYSDSDDSLEDCASTMAKFVTEFAEPTFLKWRDRKELLAEESPLYDEEKVALEEALKGNLNQENVERSRRELKVE